MLAEGEHERGETDMLEWAVKEERKERPEQVALRLEGRGMVLEEARPVGEEEQGGPRERRFLDVRIYNTPSCCDFAFSNMFLEIRSSFTRDKIVPDSPGIVDLSREN